MRLPKGVIDQIAVHNLPVYSIPYYQMGKEPILCQSIFWWGREYIYVQEACCCGISCSSAERVQQAVLRMERVFLRKQRICTQLIRALILC